MSSGCFFVGKTHFIKLVRSNSRTSWLQTIFRDWVLFLVNLRSQYQPQTRKDEVVYRERMGIFLLRSLLLASASLLSLVLPEQVLYADECADEFARPWRGKHAQRSSPSPQLCREKHFIMQIVNAF